ncbi:MAG: hypothetical protein RL291_1685 [Pseudomonadota bacterium]|jgi:uncharacterized protein YqfA (UPF0365 family)
MRAVLLAVGLWFASATAGFAQVQSIVPEQLKGIWPEVSITEAFEAAFSKAVLAKAGDALASGADAKCRAEKKLDARTLFERADETMVSARAAAVNRAQAMVLARVQLPNALLASDDGDAAIMDLSEKAT